MIEAIVLVWAAVNILAAAYFLYSAWFKIK